MARGLANLLSVFLLLGSSFLLMPEKRITLTSILLTIVQKICYHIGLIGFAGGFSLFIIKYQGFLIT